MMPLTSIKEDAAALREIVANLAEGARCTSDLAIAHHLSLKTALRLMKALQVAGVVDHPPRIRIVPGRPIRIPPLAWKLTDAYLHGKVPFDPEALLGAPENGLASLQEKKERLKTALVRERAVTIGLVRAMPCGRVKIVEPEDADKDAAERQMMRAGQADMTMINLDAEIAFCHEYECLSHLAENAGPGRIISRYHSALCEIRDLRSAVRDLRAALIEERARRIVRDDLNSQGESIGIWKGLSPIVYEEARLQLQREDRL